jgi:CheY-like chemotaxis protein
VDHTNVKVNERNRMFLELPESQAFRQQVVLLVDDEEDILESLKDIIEKVVEGMGVKTEDGGALAIEMLKGMPVDLIITDYKMPGMNGADFLAQAQNVAPRAQRALISAFPETALEAGRRTAGGLALVGDADRYFHAYNVRDGKHLWQMRLGTSVQGFPISFSIDGQQYIAVTSGLGGGSPRRIPSLLAREIRYPETGNALYVFALSDNK